MRQRPKLQMVSLVVDPDDEGTIQGESQLLVQSPSHGTGQHGGVDALASSLP